MLDQEPEPVHKRNLGVTQAVLKKSLLKKVKPMNCSHSKAEFTRQSIYNFGEQRDRERDALVEKLKRDYSGILHTSS